MTAIMETRKTTSYTLIVTIPLTKAEQETLNDVQLDTLAVAELERHMPQEFRHIPWTLAGRAQVYELTADEMWAKAEWSVLDTDQIDYGQPFEPKPQDTIKKVGLDLTRDVAIGDTISVPLGMPKPTALKVTALSCSLADRTFDVEGTIVPAPGHSWVQMHRTARATLDWYPAPDATPVQESTDKLAQRDKDTMALMPLCDDDMTPAQKLAWKGMIRHLATIEDVGLDPRTGEYDATALVESAAWEFHWDQLLDDPDHIIWTLALDVVFEIEASKE